MVSSMERRQSGQPYDYQSQGYELVHPMLSAGTLEGTGPADPKLQDLHDTGKQKDNQEEFQ